MSCSCRGQRLGCAPQGTHGALLKRSTARASLLLGARVRGAWAKHGTHVTGEAGSAARSGMSWSGTTSCRGFLAGISEIPVLRDILVFKGGTALKKCYFGDYRFSEDLDFSALEGVPTGDSLETWVGEAGGAAVRLLDEYVPVEMTCERYVEREPHPRGQEAFALRARLPARRRVSSSRCVLAALR